MNIPPTENDRFRSCRAYRSPIPGAVYCLTPKVEQCEHLGHFDGWSMCLNPERENIIAQTEMADAEGK